MNASKESPLQIRLRLLRETDNVKNASKLVEKFGHKLIAPPLPGQLGNTVDYLLRFSAFSLGFLDSPHRPEVSA